VIDYVAGSDRLANQDAAFSRAAVLHWLCFPVSGGRRLTVESPGRCPGSPDPGTATDPLIALHHQLEKRETEVQALEQLDPASGR
jgi:hypothetical protein